MPTCASPSRPPCTGFLRSPASQTGWLTRHTYGLSPEAGHQSTVVAVTWVPPRPGTICVSLSQASGALPHLWPIGGLPGSLPAVCLRPLPGDTGPGPAPTLLSDCRSPSRVMFCACYLGSALVQLMLGLTGRPGAQRCPHCVTAPTPTARLHH